MMPVKNDRNDARAIASCMRVGWYSVVHIKSEASQELRMLLSNRRTLQGKQIDIGMRSAERFGCSGCSSAAESLPVRSNASSASWLKACPPCGYGRAHAHRPGGAAHNSVLFFTR